MMTTSDTDELLDFQFDQLTTQLESASAKARGIRAEIRIMKSNDTPEWEISTKYAELNYQVALIDYTNALKKIITAKNRLKLEKDRRAILLGIKK